MRELKFRAWWKDTKRFLDGDEWYMTCSGAKHLHYSCYPYSDDDFVIEQYTGLKDKNGKEIYEGDIVKQTHSNLVYPVRFEYGGFLPFTSDMMTFDNDYCEVIGNIHENPELVGGEE